MRFVYLFLFSKSFISLPPSFFNSYIRFVYLLLSFHASISSRPSFRCNSTLRFVASFQFVSTLLNAVRYFFPFHFNSSLLFPIPRSFRFKLFSSLRYFLPIVSTLPSCSLSFTSSFHFTAFILLLPFRLFQCFHPVHLPLPFVSSRSFRYLLSYLSFASTLLSCSSCSSFPFNLSI